LFPKTTQSWARSGLRTGWHKGIHKSKFPVLGRRRSLTAAGLGQNSLASRMILRRTGKKNISMNTITVADGTRIFYKDWGTGQPVVFSHGWPLCSEAWDGQLLFLAQHGYRAVAHDRRGYGRSS